VWSPMGCLLFPILGVGRGQNSGPSLVHLEAFNLLHGGNAEDLFSHRHILPPSLAGVAGSAFRRAATTATF
jgi:hypothetical protein